MGSRSHIGYCVTVPPVLYSPETDSIVSSIFNVSFYLPEPAVTAQLIFESAQSNITLALNTSKLVSAANNTIYIDLGHPTKMIHVLSVPSTMFQHMALYNISLRTLSVNATTPTMPGMASQKKVQIPTVATAIVTTQIPGTGFPNQSFPTQPVYVRSAHRRLLWHIGCHRR